MVESQLKESTRRKAEFNLALYLVEFSYAVNQIKHCIYNNFGLKTYVDKKLTDLNFFIINIFILSYFEIQENHLKSEYFWSVKF